MHDGLAQVLAYVGFKAHSIGDLIDQGRQSEAKTAVLELEAAARTSYADVRTAIFDLRTTATSEFGLIAVLQEYVKHYSREWDIETTLVIAEGAPISFPAIAEVHLLRIVQEALHNVRTHAQARHARIVVAGDQSLALISVEDDGVGFDRQLLTGEHYGLATMRERAEQIHAALVVDSPPGAGTRVQVSFPLVDTTPERASNVSDSTPHRR
jgi:signal transduction histidine kinase